MHFWHWFPSQSLLRRRRKLQLDLRYEEEATDEHMELSNVVTYGGGANGNNATAASLQRQKALFNTEPDWTMQVWFVGNGNGMNGCAKRKKENGTLNNTEKKLTKIECSICFF